MKQTNSSLRRPILHSVWAYRETETDLVIVEMVLQTKIGASQQASASSLFAMNADPLRNYITPWMMMSTQIPTPMQDKYIFSVVTKCSLS